MIAVASTVVHFFKVEQRMVSKNNLMYVECRTTQFADGRTMQIADIVDFFEVPSGLSLSPTQNFWPFLQDPPMCSMLDDA